MDCVGEWKTTGTCSKTCGGGKVTQTYSITQSASNGGESCAFADGATQEADCNTHACPVDCVGEWKTTGTCSKTCGEGKVSQTYSITQSASNGGESCAFADGATQEADCNTHACPVDCVGEWKTTGTCSKTCGGGKVTQTYSITQSASNGGESCAFADGATQEADCNTHACPVDCVGEWKTTGTCSKTCGGGQVTQTYSITQFASNGGESCAFADGATQEADCNMHACEPSVTKPILPDDDNSGQCKSYCKQDTDCSNGLVCFHRDFAEKVPGCEGPFQLFRGYCVTPAQIKGNIHNVGVNPIKILKECEGDCENDAMCEGGLVCMQRDGDENVPGCNGSPIFGWDYCVKPSTDWGTYVQ